MKYNYKNIEKKWLPLWEKSEIGKVHNTDIREKKYIVDMFAYPSGDLHMGHAEAFAIADVWARYLMHCGFAVLHPIGWDSFGLPAENAAIKNNTHPADWTYKNIDTQAKSFKRYGLLVDWSRRIHTSDPEYYKWTQWIFIQFYKQGLAYRKKSAVNWCPKDKTVLANEQSIEGKCERCNTKITKKFLNQWYFKITSYKDRLLNDINDLEGNWPNRVLSMQKNWIGRTKGVNLKFFLQKTKKKKGKIIEVFTDQPYAIFGVTFIVISVESNLAREIIHEDKVDEFDKYLENSKNFSERDLNIQNKKTGIFSGRYTTNPITGEKIPVWISNYVFSKYCTDVIMAVPAHDQQDLNFALTFNLPIKIIYKTNKKDPALSKIAIKSSSNDIISNSGFLTNYNKEKAFSKILDYIEKMDLGKVTINYRLRDWLVSRQRFWGTPIPILHCKGCGEVPIPEEQLPLELPKEIKNETLTPKGVSPLSGMDFWNLKDCPKCGNKAKIDGDTMDTFVDSSWYFLRYINPVNSENIFNTKDVNHWGPVDYYIGGVEHAILHLLYSRFITKVLYDLKYINFKEPFKRVINQGQVLNKGKAMSKSLGNGVNLGEQIDKFGVDAIRVSIIFAGPPEDDIDWQDMSPEGATKFLSRAWKISKDINSKPTISFKDGNKQLRIKIHRTIKEVTDNMHAGKFNIIVARTMELVNYTRKAIDNNVDGDKDPASREAAKTIAIILSLIAPYTAEEMWCNLGYKFPIATAIWPISNNLKQNNTKNTLIIQIDGKVRHKTDIVFDNNPLEIENEVLKMPNIIKAINGKKIIKIINKIPKIINIVTDKKNGK